MAAQEGWYEVVKAALEIGSVVDFVDKLGRTPLSYTAEQGNVMIVRILMEASALPITEDLSRRIPLSYAAGDGRTSVVEMLLKDPRVNVHARDMQNRSALHWAAANGHDDAIKCLVDHGARVDDVDSEHTPLLSALINGRRRKADRWRTADLLLLMKSKLDTIIQDKEAWEWALENGEWVCAEFLLKRQESTKGIGLSVAIPANQWIEPIMGQLLRDSWLQSTYLEEKRTQQSSIEFAPMPDLLSEMRTEKISAIERLLQYASFDFKMEIKWFKDILQQGIIYCEGGLRMITVLLDLLDEEILPEIFIEAAAGNRSAGYEVTKLILDQRGDQVLITEEVVKAAAENADEGEDIIELLLDQRGDQVLITDKVAKVIAKNFSAEIVQLLLKQQGDQVSITEEVVKAAAGNIFEGCKVMQLFVKQQGDQILITEEVVKAATENKLPGKEILRLLGR